MDDREYKIDKILIKFMAEEKIIQKKDIAYLKYRVQYTNKKDFEGHFDCKKPEEGFNHEIKGTTQERIQILQEMNQRKCLLSLKKKKNLLGNDVLGKTEHLMTSLSRTSSFIEEVEFKDCGIITFEVTVQASLVTEDDKKEAPKVGFFAKAASVVTLGQLGADLEVAKEQERLKQQALAEKEAQELAAAALLEEERLAAEAAAAALEKEQELERERILAEEVLAAELALVAAKELKEREEREEEERLAEESRIAEEANKEAMRRMQEEEEEEMR